ncbi:DNA (cytosine-5-)-methyltransferase (TIGR00675) [uncultured Mediterranean phage uvMED]|nr:DNA (cytosine-5-)-methyltransferase (TIGR00675) [uncultured Mediterranean phage uvMED]
MDTAEKLPSVLSFCSGYGGLERGLDLAGFEHRVIAYVEIEAYAIANLANKMERGKLLPAPIWSNLKTLPVEPFRDRVDLITGGYPCQPFSAAGERKGDKDPRHLWPHIRRHIKAIRPVRCFFENVEGHISLGLREVISDLESLGYVCAWGIFSAREVGAPHQRKRVYILGNSQNNRLSGGSKDSERQGPADICKRSDKDLRSKSQRSGKTLADSNDRRGKVQVEGRQSSKQVPGSESKERRTCNGQWEIEPRLGRVVNGCSDRVDRIRALGNGVVPQTAAKAWMTLNLRFK